MIYYMLLMILDCTPSAVQDFTVDTVSIYTNIDTYRAVNSIWNFVSTNQEFSSFPIEAIIDTINLIMNINVF